MSAIDTAHGSNGTAPGRGAATGRDALYASVGAGLLAFQRLQVARRELERSMNGAGGPCAQVRQGIDRVLDVVEDRAPQPVGEALHRYRDAVDSLTRTLSTVLGLTLPTDRPGPVE